MRKNTHCALVFLFTFYILEYSCWTNLLCASGMFWNITWTSMLILLEIQTPTSDWLVACSLAKPFILCTPFPLVTGQLTSSPPLFCTTPPLASEGYSSSAVYGPIGLKFNHLLHIYFPLILLLDNARLSKDDRVPRFLNLNSLRPLQKYYFKTLKTNGLGVGAELHKEIKLKAPDSWPPPPPGLLGFY